MKPQQSMAEYAIASAFSIIITATAKQQPQQTIKKHATISAIENADNPTLRLQSL